MNSEFHAQAAPRPPAASPLGHLLRSASRTLILMVPGAPGSDLDSDADTDLPPGRWPKFSGRSPLEWTRTMRWPLSVARARGALLLCRLSSIGPPCQTQSQTQTCHGPPRQTSHCLRVRRRCPRAPGPFRCVSGAAWTTRLWTVRLLSASPAVDLTGHPSAQTGNAPAVAPRAMTLPSAPGSAAGALGPTIRHGAARGHGNASSVAKMATSRQTAPTKPAPTTATAAGNGATTHPGSARNLHSAGSAVPAETGATGSHSAP